MSVTVSKNREARIDEGVGPSLVLPPSTYSQTDREDTARDVREIDRLGELVPVIMPTAIPQDRPEQQSKELVECELYASFNEALNDFSSNSIQFKFKEHYSPEDHGSQPGEIPAFLAKTYEERVGGKLNSEVEALLKDSEAMLLNDSLTENDIVKIYNNFTAIHKLCYQRNVANSMLGVSMDKSTLGINPEMYERFQSIGRDLNDRCELVNNLIKFADPAYIGPPLFKSPEVGLKLLDNLVQNGLLHRVMSEDGRINDSSAGLPTLSQEALEEINTLFSEIIKEGLRKVVSNPSDEKEIEDFRSKLEKIHSIANSSSAISEMLESIKSTYCNEVLLLNLTPILRDENFWDKSTTQNIEDINQVNQKTILELNAIDEFLGTTSATAMARKMIDAHFLIENTIKNKYSRQIFELRDNIESSSVGEQKECFEQFRKKEEHLTELMDELGRSNQFKEYKNTQIRKLQETIDKVLKKSVLGCFEHYKTDGEVDRISVENDFSSIVSPIKNYVEKALTEDSKANSLENIAKSSYLFTSKLETTFAAEILLEEYLDKGSNIDPIVVRNILQNTIDRIDDKERILFDKSTQIELETKYKKALQKGVDLATQNPKLSISQSCALIYDLLHVDTDLDKINASVPEEAIDFFDLGLPLRFKSLVEDEFEKLLVDNASEGNSGALMELYSSARFGYIVGIHNELEWRKDAPNLNALDMGLFKILASLDMNIPREKLKLGETNSTISETLSGESKLKSLSRVLDLDKGLAPAEESFSNNRRVIALKFSLGLIDNLESASIDDESKLGSDVSKFVQTNERLYYENQRNSLLRDILELNYFPDITTNEMDLRAQIQAIARLSRLSPKETGQLARLYLEDCQKRDDIALDTQTSDKVGTFHLNMGQENLSHYLVSASEKTLDYNKLKLPKLLDRQSQDSELKSAALEFLVGFVGPNKGLHRSQLELFHVLTREVYKTDDAFSYENVETFLKNAYK